MSNGKPAVELSFRFELDFGPEYGDAIGNGPEQGTQPYLLSGHLDRVVEFNDHLFVMDHKTTTTTRANTTFTSTNPTTK